MSKDKQLVIEPGSDPKLCSSNFGSSSIELSHLILKTDGWCINPTDEKTQGSPNVTEILFESEYLQFQVRKLWLCPPSICLGYGQMLAVV